MRSVFKDAGFSDLYRKYLNTDLSNPEIRDPRPEMEAAGKAGADGIRAYIDSNIPPPNSPVTVNGGWIYNRAAHKSVYVPGKGFNKPLFDTGALYDAFDYEIEE